MRYILGVDQGGTHTRAVVCDIAGNILGVGQTYGACHAFDGMARAMNAVKEAAELALDQAGVQSEDVVIIFCGLTGADWPDEYDLLKTNVLSLGLCQNVWIKNDTIIALRGGTSANYGAIVIAGTGGNCAIRSPSGDEYVYHYYHDQELQGGTALGRRALRAIYRAETSRELATRLTAWVLNKFNLTTVDDLLRAQCEQRLEEDDIKHIAPLIFQAASEGDRVASDIIWSFGTGLAELVTAGLQRFNMTTLDVEVVLSGGIFKGPGQLLPEVMSAYIHTVAPKARLVNARYEPVVGACLLGLEALGIMIDEPVKVNIERSSQRFNLIRLVP